MRHYLATAEALIQVKDCARPLEDVLRSAHLREGMTIQDIDGIEWQDKTQAHVRLALVIPIDEEADCDEDCDEVIRTSLIGEEFTICRGTMTIMRVYEVDLFDEMRY